MQTVYIELLFIDDFLMDALILFFSMRTAHLKIKIRRILLSALIGAAYSAAALFFGPFSSPAFKIPLSFLMVFICTGKVSGREFLIAYCGFFAFSMMTAGAVLLISHLAGEELFGFIRLPLMRLLFAGGLCAAFCSELILRRNQLSTRQRYCVTARFGKCIVKLDAMLDTASSLCTPDGEGIIVADISSVLSQLSFENASEILIEKGKTVNCVTVSGSKNLKSIFPDEIKISDGKTTRISKGSIALCESLNYKGCNALLPSTLNII